MSSNRGGAPLTSITSKTSSITLPPSGQLQNCVQVGTVILKSSASLEFEHLSNSVETELKTDQFGSKHMKE